MDFFNNMPIIDDATPDNHVFDPQFARGTVPRDYNEQPVEMFAPATSIPLIPQSEWDARYDEMIKEKSSIQDVRDRAVSGQPMPYLNQGSFGFCWGHSTTHAVMLMRAMMNLPYVPLSAFGLVHFSDEARAKQNRGGWCGLSAQGARTKGIPTQAVYPQGRVANSVTQAMLDDGQKHLVTQDFVDLQQPVWFQNLPFESVMSCLFMNRPCAVDFNWWGHSVCAMKPVRIERGRWGYSILNSWLNYGDNGVAVLSGDRAKPNGAIAVDIVKATP